MSFSGSSYLPMSNYESPISAIYNTFRRLWSTLIDRQSDANEAIDNWSRGFMNQIGDHALRQKRLVAEAYEVHQKHLETLRDQYLEINTIYEGRKDAEETKRLLEKCKTLQVELVNLKFSSVDKEFIEVTMIQPSERMDEEKAHSDQTENDQFGSKQVGNNETGSASGRYSTVSAHSKPTATALDGTNQLPTTQFTNVYTRSTSATDEKNSKTDLNNTDDPIEKCPICLMIFPLNMSATGRAMHVDDHLNED